MKKLLLTIALLATTWLAGTPALALDQDGEGYYLIGSKADLAEWKGISNYLSSKVKLTADIDDLDFMLSTDYFQGTFDGDGHYIELNNPPHPTNPSKAIGLFASTSGATIKNLIVKGKITTTVKNSAGISTWNGGASTFENVVSIVEIDYNHASENGSNGGFIGYNKANATFINCVSAPTFTGNRGYNQGLVGWENTGTISLTNCIIISNPEEVETSSYSIANPVKNISATNTYIVKTSADADTPVSGCSYVSAEQMASGYVTYNINSAAGSNVLFQTLGTDDYPVPFNTHGTVYASGRKHCDGSDYDGVVYNNTSGETINDEHSYSDFHCTYCSAFQSGYKSLVDGYYELSSAADVKWFAYMVNENISTTAKAKLTADIDLDGVTYTPIGNTDEFKYNGVFDGQGHRILNMKSFSQSAMIGFFGAVRGGSWIKNLIIDKSCEITGTNYVGGVCGKIQTQATVEDRDVLLIENCVNEANIEATDGAAAGIAGAGAPGYPKLLIQNCINVGNVKASGKASAICAYNNYSGSGVNNCINIGKVEPGEANCDNIWMGSNRTHMDNLFDISSSTYRIHGAGHEMTTEAIANGQLCYAAVQGGASFYQTIGTDDYPMPFNTSEEVNYVGDAGYTTFYDASNDWKLNGDAQAFIGSFTPSGSALHLTEIDDIPHGSAVVIGGTYYNMVSTTATANTEGNVLLGSDGTITGDGTSYYALSTLGGTEPIGFYPVASGITIPSGKAYLDLTGSSPVKGFTFVFEDDATGIESIQNSKFKIQNEGSIYNLAGQKLSKMQKGINIVNGRKVLF